ncbi:hypothetical protein GCM10023340_27380 [Nocardioides marinquilinus]|uniref:LysM domain-containing protein n=1 Tax=Nocardioides marinquilinus TaxID=1210400 RepID=A0ABP9PSS6_9ACTN
MRALAVWSVVTTVSAATGGWAAAGVRPADLADPHFEVLLPALASLVVCGCAVWAWLCTTVVVVAALRRPGRPATVRGVPRWLARALLAACGVAVLTAVPGHATTSGTTPGEPGLDGLPYPDRATGAAGRPHRPDRSGSTAAPLPRAEAAPTPVDAVRVRPGDSLWSISTDRLGHDADAAEVAAHTAALHALNRPVVGPDPDVIHPGQRLRLPPRESPDP